MLQKNNISCYVLARQKPKRIAALTVARSTSRRKTRPEGDRPDNRQSLLFLKSGLVLRRNIPHWAVLGNERVAESVYLGRFLGICVVPMYHADATKRLFGPSY
ncbi:protein of unknown function [Methylocaldum szegediense]|uniref:LysR substrate-binding domain-containing protein n=1 Tax=Methylocaldum szegediense TaxID=73780 RepID=A0ABN8X745_9GAMM|nr:protein of unknown function [Methylocaldum szegediense]